MYCGREEGFTFNELLVAMGLVVVAIMGSALSSVNVFRRQVSSDHSTVAVHLAQDKIEELQVQRLLPDSDNCPASGEHKLSATSGVGGLFNRCWRITPSAFGGGLKQIDVVVSWRDQEMHEVKLSTLIFKGEDG